MIPEDGPIGITFSTDDDEYYLIDSVRPNFPSPVYLQRITNEVLDLEESD